MTADDTRLTELVREAAETIQPTDRLAEVRAAARAADVRRRRRAWLVTGGASLATAAAVAAVAFAVAPGGDRAAGPDPGGDPSVTPGPTETPTTPEPTPSETASAGSDDLVAVPVYYVGDAPPGPRLYREFQRVPAADRLLAAARAATSGAPLDPDYRSAWGGDVVESVSFDGIDDDGELQVVFRDDFSDAALAIPTDQAELAIQALVYSVQGAAQATAPVTFWIAGERVDSLLGVDVSQPLARASQLKVLALVNVTTPAQGTVVSDGSLEASGVASSFEATVPWAILDATGATVQEGSAMAAGWMDRLYPWESVIDVSGLAPGDYTFVAKTDDPSGGAEGNGPFEDTKDFTIE